MSLVLASASPRRAELLRQVGIPFEIIEPGIVEKPDYTLLLPEMVIGLARHKALAVSARLEQGIVLAADTIVLYRGKILGKPRDREDARCMLRLLSGDAHQVLTGVILVDAATGKDESGLSVTKVWMKELSEKVIYTYVGSSEPLDKAGAYGIQGKAALFVEKIEGCYFNVVGLPLSLFYDLTKRMNLEI